MQVVNGLIIGCPGPVGSPPIYLLYDSADPANSTNPNVTQGQVGSLLVKYVDGTLWQKTAPNTWTQIS